MKILLFVAILAAVSASDVPEVADLNEIESGNARFVDDLISAAIENVIRQIRESGMDPFEYEGLGGDYALPVPTLFNIDAGFRNLRVTGFSNIIINNINFSFITQVVTLDISIPEINISVGDAMFDVTIMGRYLAGRTISRISIKEPRVFGTIQVNVFGIIIGPLVRSVDLQFDLKEITYDGFMMLQGYDYGPVFRNFVSVTIPNILKEMKAEVDELVNYIARDIVDNILSN